MRLQDHPTGGVRPVARCSQTHIQHRPCPSPREGEEEEAFSNPSIFAPGGLSNREGMRVASSALLRTM